MECSPGFLQQTIRVIPTRSSHVLHTAKSTHLVRLVQKQGQCLEKNCGWCENKPALEAGRYKDVSRTEMKNVERRRPLLQSVHQASDRAVQILI